MDSPILRTPEAEREEFQEKARETLRRGLVNLADSFSFFVQTTHGTMKGHSFRDVIDALSDCYANPTAFTISDMV